MKLSRLLLTSASLATLAVAGLGRASAATGITVTQAGHLPYTVAANVGWINVHSSDISTFTNNQDISDGFANPDFGSSQSVGLGVRADSAISTLINGPAGNITAIEGTSVLNDLSTPAATATALLIRGLVPSVVNNGTIRAVAIARQTKASTAAATATAVGYKYDRPSVNLQVNHLTNNGLIVARARAHAAATNTSSAFAAASATAVKQTANHHHVGMGVTATLSVTNGGIIRALGIAFAVGASNGASHPAASADATAIGVTQSADDTGSASVLVANTGSIVARASAHALAHSSTAEASARATGIGQFARGTGTGVGTVTNSALVRAVAAAAATGTSYATATAHALGIGQDIIGAQAKALVQNTGSIVAVATGAAKADHAAGFVSYASASGHAAAIIQTAEAFGSATSIARAITQNSGVIRAVGRGHAQATYAATATGRATGARQLAHLAHTALDDFNNSGSIFVNGQATALADFARASADAVGVSQHAEGAGAGSTATSRLTNTGTLQVSARALAKPKDASGTYAEAAAVATGVSQDADGGAVGLDDVNNSGTIAVLARGSARDGAAGALARAGGVDQFLDDALTGSATARLRNAAGGVISAGAIADAIGGAGASGAALGVAVATGVDVHGGGLSFPLTLDMVNNGLILASASAAAHGADPGHNFALAHAMGIGVFGDTLAGSIVNRGTIVASAHAVGSHALASAIGIFDPSQGNNTHIVNSGAIRAYAAAATYAHATAIGIGGDGSTPGSKTVITNDGDLWAGISTDGGKTVHWGNAINTENAGGDGPAPNPVLIQLNDDLPSHVFGNIEITAADAITVDKGATFLDGVINADHDLEGTLDILATGKLVLTNHDPVNGPSAVFIDTYTNHVTGTLGVELTPSTDPTDYPLVEANTANLRGTLFAEYRPGIYGGHLVYEDVIDANFRNGLYDQVLDNSALLETRARYDGAGNVDLVVDRLAFSAVPGLSGNQKSVAQALDTVSLASLGGGSFSAVVGQLFALDNAAYAQALNALSGAEFAQLDQSILWSTGQLNSTITDRMDCGANWAASASGQEDRRCFVPGKTQVWARIHGSWNNNDGDANAPGYDESQMGVFGGADHAFTNDWFVGLAGGYFTSDMGFDDWSGAGGSSIDYSGLQAALYGGYDDGTWYARGIGSFGLYNGDSHRNFGLTSTPIDPTGRFDAAVESFYGEFGRRYAITPQATATPFLGVGVAHSNVGGFTESDPNGSGVALAVGDASGDSLASVVGGRVAGHWGAWRPELAVAWQHEYLDTVQTVHNSLVAAPGAPGFSVASSDPGRDFALVGLSATYAVNPANDFMLKYDGRLAGDYSSHSLVARWDTRF